MKNIIKLNLFKPIKLSFVFTVIMSVIIITTMLGTTFYAMSKIGDLIGDYNQEISKLRNTMAIILIDTFKADLKRKDFEATRSMINELQSGNFLSYVYIKNNIENEFIMVGPKADLELDRSEPNILNLNRDIGDYTMYLGISTKDSSESSYGGFYGVLSGALFAFILLGFFISTFISDIVSTPLKKLAHAAREIADGNFNVKIKNSIFSEFNDLIYTYNEMGFQLKELYSSLELKVQERTIALEQANYKLKETQAMMVHSEKMRSLGELVAGIAHEINNPVNFIHGNIMILQNYSDDLLKLIDLYEENNIYFPEDIKTKIQALRDDIDIDFLRTDIKDLIKSCIEGTQRTKNIVLDLKNFSRMEEMVLTQFDIPKEIDTTLNILNNKYKNRITVIKNYAPNTPKIEAYGGQLNQVFMNILDNAQDAIEGNGTLTINTFREDENAKIEFIDTGKGIPEENLKKVFDPFFTTKPVGKGTGLGMSISYRVINDHNGKIEVDSKLGKGTKFTITLPIVHEGSGDVSMEEKIIHDLREENGVTTDGNQI